MSDKSEVRLLRHYKGIPIYGDPHSDPKHIMMSRGGKEDQGNRFTGNPCIRGLISYYMRFIVVNPDVPDSILNIMIEQRIQSILDLHS